MSNVILLLALQCATFAAGLWLGALIWDDATRQRIADKVFRLTRD